MSESKTGGPAFPVDRKYLGDGQYANQPGMTLRDWFAGQALAGITSRVGETAEPPDWAEIAYRLADAMLAECAKEPRHD